MKNFVLHNPTKIIFGKNTINKIGPETYSFGCKVFLIFGEYSVKQNGILDQVSCSLKDAGCIIIEFGGVKSNPLLSHVRTGIEQFKKNNCDVICAVGGGSVIDSAKAISAGVKVEHDVWKFFTTKKSISSTAPLTCVSTLAASGSDNNSGMVLTRDQNQLKFGYGNRFLYPKVSILDPEATYSVPKDYTAYGAVDIVSHLLEFYLTTMVPSSPVQDRIIEGLMMSVMESCNNALINGRDYAARAELMWAASLALSGLTAAGLGRVGFPMHLIEHSLSAIYNVPHGAGLAVIIPGWMTFHAEKHPEKIAQLGENIFKIKGNCKKDIATETIAKFTNWFKDIDCPVTLGELSINPDHHVDIAVNTQPLAKVWRLKEYDVDTVCTILKLCR